MPAIVAVAGIAKPKPVASRFKPVEVAAIVLVASVLLLVAMFAGLVHVAFSTVAPRGPLGVLSLANVTYPTTSTA